MNPPDVQILIGDCRQKLQTIDDESVQCCVTSPPYWGLRDYGTADQIGLEETPEEWVQQLLVVFEEVWRVLKPDGTLWINLGDCYSVVSNDKKSFRRDRLQVTPTARKLRTLKPKDLVGQPWMMAFALRDAGWYLRQENIWHKPNPMPESCKDRPTRAHEQMFLLSKSECYFYDQKAIREPVTGNAHARGNGVNPKSKFPDGWQSGKGSHDGKTGRYRPRQNASFSAAVNELVDSRNKRSVWTIPAQPYRGAHFATFPKDLVIPCILAGTRIGDRVLDPFAGSGTTGEVAVELGRHVTLIDSQPDYLPMMRERTTRTPALL